MSPVSAVDRAVAALDAWGKDFAVWIPGYAAIGAVGGPTTPGLPSQTPYPGDVVIDGGFESGSLFPNWEATTVGVSLERTKVYKGNYALKLDKQGVGAVCNVDQVTTGVLPTGFHKPWLVPILPSGSVQVEGAGMWSAGSAGRLGGIYLRWWDQNYAEIVATNFVLTWDIETTYTKKTTNVMAPTGAFYFSVSISTDVNLPGDIFYCDESHIVVIANAPITISPNRGDANVTIVAGVDEPTQQFATNLSANRTVTLGAGYKGARFRIVRTGLGAFTLAVGGLKTIPNSTAAFVDIEHDGANWVLTGYGLL